MRVRKILQSRLNGGNTIQAINTWAVAIMRYGAGILNWTINELKQVNSKTRKLMTIHRMHHPQGDIDRLYLPRKAGGRGLISVKDCVKSGEKRLYCYLKGSSEMLLKVVREENIVKNENEETSDIYKEQKKNERQDKWRGKKLHGQFFEKNR